jgi:hypothetical protein
MPLVSGDAVYENPFSGSAPAQQPVLQVVNTLAITGHHPDLGHLLIDISFSSCEMTVVDIVDVQVKSVPSTLDLARIIVVILIV